MSTTINISHCQGYHHARHPASLLIGILYLVGLSTGAFPPRLRSAEPQKQKEIQLASPDKKLRIHFALRDVADDKAVPSYRVLYRDKVVVEESTLGLEFAGTGPFRSELRIVKVTRREYDKTWRLSVGKSSTARDHYREAVFLLEERAKLKRRIALVLRAYDDGIAFRYRIPEQAGGFKITDEHSHFVLSDKCVAHALPLRGYTTPSEAYYTVVPLKKLKPGQLFGLPLLLKHPAGVWIAITEANLTDYAGMFLSRQAEASDKGGAASVLVTKLAPRPGQAKVKVETAAPHASPWRVLMIADEPGKLIESNLIVNLNEPCAIADTSWIKPGKVLFPWWNGYVVKGEKFKGGLNTATMKHYIDFCAESGIESFSLDGFRDQAWYGGRIQPKDSDKLEDITTAIPEINLPEVLRHAKKKKVRLRIWMHWKPLKPQINRAFAVYEKWGIEGVMVDFLDRNDQEMVNFYHEVVKKAAKHHLTVNFHGAYKPTGLRRTYPNLLTREGVLNLEYNKFRNSKGSTPRHELLVPFTRMLAGPLDYHQGGFRHVVESEFKPQWIGPLVMGTRARTLASYVVYENHLPMVADYPAAYRGQTGLAFLKQVPVNWDETRVVNASVGEFITVVRRRGRDWYVGSMTDSAKRKLAIPLRFLPTGRYVAEIYADDPKADDAPAKVVRKKFLVTAADTISSKLSPAGGHVIRLTPAPRDSKLPKYCPD